MQKAASSNLIFIDSSSLKRLAKPGRRVSHIELYQGIAQTLTTGFHTERILGDFATRLASIADHAYLHREFDVVGHVGQVLLKLPAKPIKAVGQHYQALSLRKGGLGDSVGAATLLQQVADSAPLLYRARAMLALGAISHDAGDDRTAISFYREVARIETRNRVFDPMTSYTASRMTAVIRSRHGDHQGAVADLERMFPLARMASSHQSYAYYDYLNTLAVELGEVGRLEQARRASEIAIASPFARAYPEWRETFDEIEAKQRRASRSVVGVRLPISEFRGTAQSVNGTRKDNVLRLPAAEPSVSAGISNRHATAPASRVIDLQEWKATFKASTSPLREKLSSEQMTTGEKLIRLMDLISQDETDDETIDRILEAVEQIVLNRRSKN
jgi:tetratricopeptide (TPR) repeat protein